MRHWAAIENNIVINTIIADTKEIAEGVTGLTCIEFFIPPVPGDQFDGEKFIPQS